MSYSLLFDIGNVIVNFDFQISVRKIAPMCGVPPKSIFQQVMTLKDELETGHISADEFLDQAIAKIGYMGDRQFLVNAFQDVFELNTEMVELIKSESEKETPLYLLSNTNGIHIPFLFENYEVFACFDDAIYSHVVRCMKPDPAIYEKTTALLNLIPEKTIYIDDMPENCIAGEAHGFQAICYRKDDHSGFLEHLGEVKERICHPNSN